MYYTVKNWSNFAVVEKTVNLESFRVINTNAVISASSGKLVSFLVEIHAVNFILRLYKNHQYFMSMLSHVYVLQM